MFRTTGFKIAVALVIVILFVAGFQKRSKQQAQNKIVAQSSARNTHLRASVERLRTNRSCDTAVDKPKCFIDFVAANGGVTYATDLGLFTAAAIAICGSADVHCVDESFERLYPLVDTGKIRTAIESDAVQPGSQKFAELYNLQLQFVERLMTNRRHLLETRLGKTQNADDKANLNRYIATINKELTRIVGSK